MIMDPLADYILGRELSPSSTIVIDRRENPADDEPPVEIRVIDGPAVPATVGAPEDSPEADDESADEPAADE